MKITDEQRLQLQRALAPIKKPAAIALAVMVVLVLGLTLTSPGRPPTPTPTPTPTPEPEPAAADRPERPAGDEPVVAATEEPAPQAATATPPSAEIAAAEREELTQTCERIAAKLGSVSIEDCTGSRLQLSGARSAQGTPILVAEYPPLAEREPLGRVLLFGGIHGDEFSSVSIVYSWLRTLERNHSGLFHWRIAPLVNPDGLLRARSQRMNDRGVDLNRNFPSPNWRVEASDYWIRRTSRNPRRYPGEEPLSEPESRWLHDQIETFVPAAIVAVHAPSHVVDYDGPPEPPDRLGPLLLKRMGTYPGSLGRFAGIHLGLPVVTIELPSAGIMPTRDEQRQMWLDLVTWLKQKVPDQMRARTAQVESPPITAAAGMQR